MEQFNIHEAKTHFSNLLKRAMAGETIIIAKAGKPVAELRPLPAAELQASVANEIPKPRRVPGIDKRKVLIGDDFDDPSPEFEEFM